ncbi:MULTISPECIES: hypothetical protein [unclassified Streptomyces]|uniref:hypothetical protein n=1 Tax=unclassified Streptomyces TaxID=2593676 RepID=UPI003D8DB49D
MAGDDLDRWGVRIARWAAPSEAVLAPQVTRAYAAGGTVRRELFRTGGLAPGGFGGGITTLLPEVLDALAYAADALKAALGSQQFANAVSTAALVVSLRTGRSDPQTPAPSSSGSAADGRGPGAGGARREGGPSAGARHDEEQNETRRPDQAPAQPSAEAVRAALRLYDRLRARGVDPATAEELAAGLTARLLTSDDHGGVASFLDSLVANEPPEPTVPGPRRPRMPLRRLAGRLAAVLLRRESASGADPVGSATPPDETDGT